MKDPGKSVIPRAVIFPEHFLEGLLSRNFGADFLQMIVTGIMGIISSFNKCATYFVSTTGNRVTLHTKILSLNLATSFRGIMTPEKLMYSNCWKQWGDWNLLVATAACVVRSLYLNFVLSIKMMRLPWYRKNIKTDTAHFWNEIYLWISLWFYLSCGMKK